VQGSVAHCLLLHLNILVVTRRRLQCPLLYPCTSQQQQTHQDVEKQGGRGVHRGCRPCKTFV
jgi:hypothetical protein